MQHDIQGVYSRMYMSLVDHKAGLMSFDDMLRVWKEEAKLIREQAEKDCRKEVNDTRKEAA